MRRQTGLGLSTIDRVLMVRWFVGRVATPLLSLMHVVVVSAEALSVLVFEEE
jgi:hypothetical protein